MGRDLASSRAVASALALVAIGCSSPPTTAVCAPGATMACVCTDGRAGAQSCNPDGSGFDACVCESVDAGTPTADVGPTVDAALSIDAAPSVDAFVPRDEGSDAHAIDAFAVDAYALDSSVADTAVRDAAVVDSGPGDAGSLIPSECGSIPLDGICETSTRLATCVIPTGSGTASVVRYDCPGGLGCIIDGSGSAKCALVASCREGDAQCTDATHIRMCSGGTWVSSTCPRQCRGSALGDFCGLNVSTVALTGNVTYDFHGPNAARTDWDPTVYAGVGQGFLVLAFRGTALVDATVTTLGGSGVGGLFSIQVPAAPDPSDTVVVVAAASDGAGHLTYALASPGFTTPSTVHTADVPPMPVLWAWSWMRSSLVSGSTLRITEAMGSGAARRFDYIRYARAQAEQAFGVPGLTMLAWMEYGVGYDCGNCYNTLPATFAGLPFDSQMWLTSDANQEYWADSVTAHETGHWVMANYSTPPVEGGRHVVGGHVYPGMAWSEGFATFYSSVMRSSSVYFDKSGGVAFWVDIGARQYGSGGVVGSPAYARPTAGAGLYQLIDENEVSAMLWSLYNAPATSCSSLASCVMWPALSSPSMLVTPFGRRYTHHYWTALDGSGNPVGAVDLGDPAPMLADYLDALDCAGLGHAAIDAATNPLVNYPYNSSSPICP